MMTKLPTVLNLKYVQPISRVGHTLHEPEGRVEETGGEIAYP